MIRPVFFAALSRSVFSSLGIALLAFAIFPVPPKGKKSKLPSWSGCPPAVMNRFGPSTLVEAGGQKFIFDAGRGALQRLNQVKVPWQSRCRLSHAPHSDHVVGFPDLWLTGWLWGGQGGIDRWRCGGQEEPSA